MNGDATEESPVMLKMSKDQGHLVRDMIVYAITSARPELGDPGESLMAQQLATLGLKEATPEEILAVLGLSNDLP